MIYHITSRKAWRAALATGEYRAASLQNEGFIHCSTRSQILPVAGHFYKGQKGLIVLVIDPARLSSPLKWEPPSGGVFGEEKFPHIYGPINLDAVVKVVDLTQDPDGEFILPDL